MLLQVVLGKKSLSSNKVYGLALKDITKKIK